ncbi:proteoglycan 4-like [Zerene cesonia]|uniref:proteoglycan 4-like n=1 Tax=Zerene cesonia TaxID=33412 RepID=UPI0018E5404D|nr:proteoglycan 4-like [Zerene cesonia]
MCEDIDVKWSLLCLLFFSVQLALVALFVFCPHILDPIVALLNTFTGAVLNVLKGIASLFGLTSPTSDTSSASTILPRSTSISSFLSSTSISSSSDAGIHSLQSESEASSLGIPEEPQDVAIESYPTVKKKKPPDLKLELQKELLPQQKLDELDNAQIAQELPVPTAQPLLIPIAQPEAVPTTKERLKDTQPHLRTAQAQSIPPAQSQVILNEQLQKKTSNQFQPVSAAQPGPISGTSSRFISAAKLELVVTVPSAPILVIKSKPVSRPKPQRVLVPYRLPQVKQPQVISHSTPQPSVQKEPLGEPEPADAAQAQRSPVPPQSIKTRPRLATPPQRERVPKPTGPAAPAARPVDELQPVTSGLVQPRPTDCRCVHLVPKTVAQPKPVSPLQPLPEPDIELESEHERLQSQRRYHLRYRSRIDFTFPQFRTRQPTNIEITIDIIDHLFITSIRDLYDIERAYSCRLLTRNEYNFLLVQRKIRDRLYCDLTVGETSGSFLRPFSFPYVTVAEVHREDDQSDTNSNQNEESDRRE